ncbi:MAG: hypothetical protein ACRD0A_13400 [Acidimicrobiales bacterium]
MRRCRDRLPERELLPRRPNLFRRIWDRVTRRRRPVLAGGPWFDDPGAGPPEAGVREPLHPRPTAGVGAMSLPTPTGE